MCKISSRKNPIISLHKHLFFSSVVDVLPIETSRLFKTANIVYVKAVNQDAWLLFAIASHKQAV